MTLKVSDDLDGCLISIDSSMYCDCSVLKISKGGILPINKINVLHTTSNPSW